MQHFSRPVHSFVKNSKMSATNRILATMISGWSDICGPEFTGTTLPYKLVWAKRQHKQEGDKKQATLHILCPDALKTRIMFQEALWLDRCNRLLGHDLFNRLQTRHHDDWDLSDQPAPAAVQIDTCDNPYAALLDEILDPDLRLSLQRIGQAIAQDKQ